MVRLKCELCVFYVYVCAVQSKAMLHFINHAVGFILLRYLCEECYRKKSSGYCWFCE